MTLGKDEVVAAIAKLNDLTRQRIVSWRVTDPLRLGPSFGAGYQADYEGRRLRIIEYKPPRVQGSFIGMTSVNAALGLPPQPDRVLEIVDEDGIPLFEFPKVQGVSDLFESVRAQQADVEGLIKSLLSTP
ncbi:MAG TPA: hypothetical protein VM782_02235 [Stellaceae bacterium]|nr:hypothetical protein [Stellaceae bacterium]